MKKIKQYEKSMGIANEMLELQGKNGNYNYDSYMLGLYNGMEYIVSLLEVREPKFIDGKEMLFRQEKNNRRSKWYLEQLVNEFLDYCQEKGYNHIVMENLNLKENKSEAKNKDGINYNRIASLLHLNDIKHVIKRLANKRSYLKFKAYT